MESVEISKNGDVFPEYMEEIEDYNEKLNDVEEDPCPFIQDLKKDIEQEKIAIEQKKEQDLKEDYWEKETNLENHKNSEND